TTADEQGTAGDEGEYAREEREDAYPVRPTGHEPSEAAEGPLAPEIQAAFARIPGGEDDHTQSEGKVEDERSENPEGDPSRAGFSCLGEPHDAEARDDHEKEQIDEPHRLVKALRSLVRYAHGRSPFGLAVARLPVPMKR